MKHEYSTYILMGLLIFGGIVAVMGALQSGDIDEVCSVANSTITRNDNNWNCTSGIIKNITVGECWITVERGTVVDTNCTEI